MHDYRIDHELTIQHLSNSMGVLVNRDGIDLWLLKWLDSNAGYSADEYNAMVIDRWLGVWRVPEVILLSEKDLLRQGIVVNINNFPDWKRGWADELKPRFSATPVLLKWYPKIPLVGELEEMEAKKKEFFVSSASWYWIEWEKAYIFDALIINRDRGQLIRDKSNLLVSAVERKFWLIDNQYSIQRSGDMMIKEAKSYYENIHACIDDYAKIRHWRIQQTVEQEPSLRPLLDRISLLSFDEHREVLVGQMVVSGNGDGFEVYEEYLQRLGRYCYMSKKKNEATG